MEFELNKNNTGLLVIDMQNGFCHDDGSFGGAMGLDISPLKESISGCVKLLETARKNEYPIAFTRYIYKEDYSLVVNGLTAIKGRDFRRLTLPTVNILAKFHLLKKRMSIVR